jgi:hypothetical protein
MPRELHIPRKEAPSNAVTRQRLAEGLVPSSCSYRPYAGVECWLAHLHRPPHPHVGRHNHQVKRHHEATSRRIIPAPSTSAPRTPGCQKEHLGGKKKAMEAPTDLYEPIFSSLGPAGHVNLLLDVKVISL